MQNSRIIRLLHPFPLLISFIILVILPLLHSFRKGADAYVNFVFYGEIPDVVFPLAFCGDLVRGVLHDALDEELGEDLEKREEEE